MASWRERVLEQAEAARRRAAGVDLEQLRREEAAENTGFFAGFALGLAVGAALALIFAPLKGEEARGLVAERAGQIKDRAADLVAQVRGTPDDSDADQVEPAIEREIDDAADAAQAPARA